jgi:hypothetical protein
MYGRYTNRNHLPNGTILELLPPSVPDDSPSVFYGDRHTESSMNKKGEVHDPEIKSGQTQLVTRHRKVILVYHKVTYLLVLKLPSLVRVVIQVSVSPEVVQQVTGTHRMDVFRKSRSSSNF